MTDKENFYPISELKKYKEKYIKEITIQYKDGHCQHFDAYDFDILQIDENGNFFLSDFMFGIIEYNKKEETYGLHYYGSYKN